MSSSIEIRGLTKRYRNNVIANDAIDLDMPAGDLVSQIAVQRLHRRRPPALRLPHDGAQLDDVPCSPLAHALATLDARCSIADCAGDREGDGLNRR